MLAENVLNEKLFEFGYLGRENIYDYWSEHKDTFMKFLEKSNPRILNDKVTLESFESKIRWKSPAGMDLMEQVKHAFKQRSDLEMNHFENIKIDFDARKKIDLRGISFIKVHIEKIKISNVDFSYACFDGSILKEVVFENCVFNDVTFRESTLENCHFVKGTILERVNIRNAFVHIHSDNSLKKVQFSPIKISHAHDCLFHKETKWIPYTRIDHEEWLQQMTINQETIALYNHVQLLRYMDACQSHKNTFKRFKLYYYIALNQMNIRKKKLEIT